MCFYKIVYGYPGIRRFPILENTQPYLHGIQGLRLRATSIVYDEDSSPHNALKSEQLFV